VKKLRTSTGAGMMDCKKALAECAGDFEKATEVRPGGNSGDGWEELWLSARIVPSQRKDVRGGNGPPEAGGVLRTPPRGRTRRAPCWRAAPFTPSCPFPPPPPQWLRQKGLSGADKKAGRVATEGAVARYIHPGSRLGVLLEVNCETDFVAASEAFQSLVGEIGMIVASTDVVCVSADDMPGDLLEKERQVGARGAILGPPL
jgi:hypothetical protein